MNKKTKNRFKKLYVQQGGIVRDNIPNLQIPIYVNKNNKYSATEFMLDYINSPKYIERLEKRGYNNPKKEVQDRIQNVIRTKTENKVVPEDKGSYYNKKNEKLVMDYGRDVLIQPRPIVDLNKITPDRLGYQSIKAHELSHAELRPESLKDNPNRLSEEDNLDLFFRTKLYKNKNSFLKDPEKRKFFLSLNFVPFGHGYQPEENKADINALRYEMKKQGIYDAGKENITPEILKKAKKTFIKDRLLENYKEEDLIWLMNNIAQNNSENNVENYAEKGGKIVKRVIKSSNRFKNI